jgi:hypothetical protein
MGDQREGLDNLRDYYLQRARQLGASQARARWFTDKMPLNETHLGLIALIFPRRRSSMSCAIRSTSCCRSSPTI